MVEMHHHRSTLKQQNKPFKAKHATKSALKDIAKGRVQRQSPKNASADKTDAQRRVNRRNTAKQVQANKRHALVSSTRIFNGVDGTPRIVAVIPLSEDVSARDAVQSLASSLDVDASDCPASGLWRMRAERFRTSLQFLTLPYHSLYATLDAAKAADYVLFVLSPTVEVDGWGDTLLRTLQAQGLPSVATTMAADAEMDPKERSGTLKSLLSFIQYFVPSQTRVHDLHASADRLNALRAFAEGAPAPVRWRDGRPWVLGEDVRADDSAEGGSTRVAVTGYVRGAPLSANRLVHIPEYGDFPISKIMSAPLPRQSHSGAGMDVEPALLSERVPSDADSMVSSNMPDDLANEQTWPTEEEMASAPAGQQASGEIPDAHSGTTPRTIKRVPKGMSEYQASWVVDDDGDEDYEDEDDDEDGAAIEGEEEEEEEMVDMPVEEDEMESVVGTRKSVAFEDLDMDEEQEQLHTWKSRAREEADDKQFPDELDTPQDVPARARFARFRGMRSLRTSPWDPYENLPRDYAKLFAFEDYRGTERDVRARVARELGAVQPGARVTVYIDVGSAEAAAEIVKHGQGSAPSVVFGLLPHERKKTVLHFTVQRNTEYEGSVKSKDPLILCVGPRRMRVKPVYSQHTRGGGKGANNVHKFERFLRHGTTSVASVYGPAVFGKQPCALLRESDADAQAPELVAMGAFMNSDTTRVMAKRIVLTGHPFKVHKKTATVRYMFFSADDVLYFKPIQLHTKHGRTGHIRESLGTHGYFKAHFDGPVSQMDTVCMALYKRVFPRWSELWRGGGGGAGNSSVGTGASAADAMMEE
ncbi:ribosome biogenesis protein tsr1 [Coniophora puteana RWD-64-598 SS2]|uniref:Ribosome biogenesis protein tsr1 n=1 Tax=Coniophora puteana (strain RWD-64-598) TaxID=741705 RepID=A0A5M3MXA0_CONPW|nr:ribosome biogenesis protein tsr1 [Coniophora puteana RWD-64-598 SS2]EIW83404.1 ribosome biogenesis protein tsr1 [Coniophora puteana RWD-64-598 SS2]